MTSISTTIPSTPVATTAYMVQTTAALIINSVARGGGGAANLVSLKPSSSVKKSSSYNDPFLKDLYKKWFHLSEITRFFVSGNIGNLCFYLLEKTINEQLSSASAKKYLPMFVESYKDTVSFFIGYLLQIISQHGLNAFLVYGLHTINTRSKYLKTLIGQYSAYGFSLIGSTVLNLLLLRGGMDKTIAFFTTMAIFACINYFVIGYIVRLTTTTSSSEGVGESTTTNKNKKKKKNDPKNTKSSIFARKRFPRGGGGGGDGVNCSSPTTTSIYFHHQQHRRSSSS